MAVGCLDGGFQTQSWSTAAGAEIEMIQLNAQQHDYINNTIFTQIFLNDYILMIGWENVCHEPNYVLSSPAI